MLRQRQVDGVVLGSANAGGNTDLLQQFGALGIGLVMIDRDDHPDVSCDRVVTDDHEVGRLATTHLIAQGRKAVSHITGTPVLHARRRADGFRAAMKAAGMKVRPEWVVRGGFKETDGYQGMQKLLSIRPRVDAVFAANDPAAIGAMKAIWDAGLEVPDDIAVIGAGDIAMGDMLRVPLSTVSWSREDQGRAAAHLLLERIDRTNATNKAARQPQRVIIPPRLVVRRSSGGQ
jgi:LacI family transcriptional regulator